jgi:hypothetical protein
VTKEERLVKAREALKGKPPRPSMRQAINAKCRECIYDPIGRGTWREQVRDCVSATCSLHQLRPMPSIRKDEDGTAE